MNTLHRIAASLLFAILAPAHAGSPGGLQVVVLGSAKAAPHIGQVKSFFAMPHDDPMSCLDSQLNLNSGYRKGAPKGITADLALAAVADKRKRATLARLLSGYRDKDHKRGFDAALAYDVKGSKLTFYGISAFADADVEVSAIALADVNDKQKFNLAVCKALVNLPVMEAP